MKKLESLILLRVSQEKPVVDLLDKVAGRSYTIDGVCDVEASLITMPTQQVTARRTTSRWTKFIAFLKNE